MSERDSCVGYYTSSLPLSLSTPCAGGASGRTSGSLFLFLTIFAVVEDEC